jgi:signal transduction histidine kinase
MSAALRVLLVEDTEDDALLVLRELQRAGYEPVHQRVDSADAMHAALADRTWDIVLGDYNMPQFSGTAALAIMRERGVDAPFIFVSGTIGEDVAVAAMKAGAQDYVMKGNLKRLVPAIQRELRDAEVRRERRRAQETLLERARLAELNSDVGIALSQGVTVQEIMQRCAAAVIRHLDAVLARIWVLDEPAGELALEASAGTGPGAGGGSRRVALRTSPLGTIVRERRPYVSNAASGDPRVPDQAWVGEHGIEAFAGYPLMVQGRLVGLLGVFARRPLTDFAAKALAAMADSLAVGIEHKQAEEALRATQARLQHLLSSSGAVVYAATVHAGVLAPSWVSDNIARIMGYQSVEALSPSWWSDHLHPEDRARVLGELPALVTRGQLSVEYRFQMRDRTYRWIRDESRWRGQAGEEGEVAGVWVDVTEGRKLEEQLRQSQKMEAVGRLAGGVAHDFNNLLTVITGYCDLMFDTLPLEHPVREDVQEIRKAAEGAAGLTRQLLAFSRQQVLQPKIVDLNAVTAGVEKLLRRLIGEHIELATVLSPALGRVRADPGQLEQIIVNLAVNARDAMPQGGTLAIETANVVMDGQSVPDEPLAAPGSYVMLAVSDTGVGMDEATKARIFEPFFTTKDPGKGTGLGLATVYGVVKQSAGFVWVYSEPGRGTTFKVYFPRVDATAGPDEHVVAQAESPSGSETVLLVDDSAPVRAVSRRVLEGYGYTVLEAGTGAEALQAAKAYGKRIHLLLTDIVMPGISGRDLAAQLGGMMSGLRVLYMSGYTDDAIVRHGVLETGIAYMQKPFTGDELARKIREVLDAPGSK